jgi:FHA domain
MTSLEKSNTKGPELKLTLTILDTLSMTKGKVYEIYPYGLKSSKRNTKDGCVYAGSLCKEDSRYVNDIILSDQEKGIGKKHFLIQYLNNKIISEKGTFMIKDLGDGMGTFVRLQRPLKVQNNYIISFGDSHIIAKVNGVKLTVKFIDGPKMKEKL